MKIVREEIFGPVVAAMPFKDPDDVLPMANDTAYGLAACSVDARHQQGSSRGAAVESRHGVDQLLQCFRRGSSVWWLPGVRMGPRDGTSRSGTLHRGQGRNDQVGMTVVKRSHLSPTISRAKREYSSPGGSHGRSRGVTSCKISFPPLPVRWPSLWSVPASAISRSSQTPSANDHEFVRLPTLRGIFVLGLKTGHSLRRKNSNDS